MVPHVYTTIQNFQPSRYSVMPIFLQGAANSTSIYDTEDALFEQFGEFYEPSSVQQCRCAEHDIIPNLSEQYKCCKSIF